ncbi:hypothetical protein ABZ565_29120 [Streptomyces sp. NPDC016469]|uniref:hypothetical protein n=1 Tax=Streptomyces sp. NPDC016469 TaxID=3157191 RepID=UPI0033D7DD1B
MDDVRALALVLVSDAERLRDEVAAVGSARPADLLARVVALRDSRRLLAEWIIDLQVQQVDVPNYPPED